MSDLSFRKSANIERVTDKRKDSLFRLVDTDGSGTIDAQEFAVLYDAIKKDLAEELEKEAALEKEASSARRRIKMLLLFVAVLVSFLAASVAANFAVIFAVVDEAITTTTTTTGVLGVKGSDNIVKTAIATQDVPLMVAPALDLDTLSNVRSLKVSYSTGTNTVQSQLAVVGVRKHNATFVEFITDVAGETIETLNGVASLVVYPTMANRFQKPKKFVICSANATCSAFRANGIDIDAAMELATAELKASGFHDNVRQLQYIDSSSCSSGVWEGSSCSGSACGFLIDDAKIWYYTGYGSTRHVVFLLHGVGQTYTKLWDLYCVAGGDTCPHLELPQFKHLVFVFPSSGVRYANVIPSWASNTMAMGTLKWGAKALSSMVCGKPASPNTWQTHPPFTGCSMNGVTYLADYDYGTPGSPEYLNVGASSEIMMVGFSLGGAMAQYANWIAGSVVSKAIAIDYHAYHGPNWIAASSPQIPSNSGDHVAVKIFYSCAATWYDTDMITGGTYTFAGYASLTSTGSPVSVTGGPLPGYSYTAEDYQMWTWANGNKYLKFAVHGLDSADPDGACNSNSICPLPPLPCGSGDIHDVMPYYVDYRDEILEWVAEELPPPSLPPAPPLASSPPPSPSPSPSPSPVVISGPTCESRDWCCPKGYRCMVPRGGSSKQCVGPGDYVAQPVFCAKQKAVCAAGYMDPDQFLDLLTLGKLSPECQERYEMLMPGVVCQSYACTVSNAPSRDWEVEAQLPAEELTVQKWKPEGPKGGPKGGCKGIKDARKCQQQACVWDHPRCYDK